MEQLTRIVARRKSLEELHELVGALRTMAASSFRDASSALAGVRRYREVIERAVANAHALPGAGAWETPQGTRPVLIVVGSEHGFVGGFNQRIVEQAREVRHTGERLILVGQRAAMRAEENGLEIDDVRSMTTHVPGVAVTARLLADLVGPVAAARIVFASARPGGLPEVVVQTLLPPLPPAVAGPTFPPLHHLPPRQLLERLSDELLLAELAHALMESLSSENAARLRAMEAADRNIGNRLDQLRQREGIVRQDEITADLIEVVSGAEAVAGNAYGARNP